MTNPTVTGCVMLDVVGTRLDQQDRHRIAHALTAGVILFARNFESFSQLCELVASIRAIKPGLLIAVDHEGGRVQRFKRDGFTVLPSMASLGRLWDSDPQVGPLKALQAATSVGWVLASELRAADLDFSFTPVLDLDYGASSVIGDRAFHADARNATALAQALMFGLLQAGMANCGKHFPGHGFVAADSHLEIPVDERELDTIVGTDAQPYRWLSHSLTSVMPAHVVYPKVDSLPAGFSARWLKDILRGELGFEGAIISDDLSMEGAKGAGGVVAAAQQALNAGCDMVLVCNAPDRADELLAGLQWRSAAPSSARLARLRAVGAPVDFDALRASRRYQLALRHIKALA